MSSRIVFGYLSFSSIIIYKTYSMDESTSSPIYFFMSRGTLVFNIGIGTIDSTSLSIPLINTNAA